MIDTKYKNLINIYDENQKNFNDTINEQRDMFLDPNKKLFNHNLGHIDSLEKLYETIESGTFSIDLDNAHFRCVFNKNKGDFLYVSYNGSRKNTINYNPQFPRWSYSSIYNGYYLGIDDPMYFKYKDLKLGWYYGTKTHSYIKSSINIVMTIAKKFNIKNNKIIFFSSSGGGYASIYAASLIENSLSISINPQIYLHKYPQSNEFENITGISLNCKDILLRNNIDKIIIKSHSNHLIIVNAECYHDYYFHLKPLCSSLNIKIRYGLNIKDNVMIWIYDSVGAPNAHSLFETKSIFTFIDYIAKQWHFGLLSKIPDKIQENVILINEMWREYSLIKKDNLILKNKLDRQKATNIIILNESLKIDSIKDIQQINIKNFLIKPKPIRNNYSKIINIESNTRYTITIDYIESNTNIDKFTGGLYDFKNKTIIYYNIYKFDTNIKINFIAGDVENIYFLIYAGIQGSTQNNSIYIKNISILKYKL